MLRSTKESDDEAELKTGRIQTRMLSTHMVNSPLRRSSRIKQAKTSPGSESDTSNNSQPVRVTRQRTATMDSIASEMVKKRLTRYASVSSDLNEATDIDVDTPTKRRLSKNTATPTKTRAANKRLTRAGSEANSPPQIKITRKTRSSSVEPESLQEQNKSQPDTPVRLRRRASILPSSSPVKEEIEEGSSTPKRLNPTITEIEELTSMDKIAVVPVLLKSDELLSLSQNKSKIRGEQVTMPEEKTVVEGQSSSEESLLRDISISDEKSADNNSSNLLESNKEKPKESLLQVEQSLIDMCQNSPAKNLAEKSFIEEEKRSNKENQTSNIISDASPEKNVQPFISNVSLSTKQSLASAFVSKSDEKENKSEETNKISLNQTEITQEKNISNVIIEDSNEMNLILEEQSSDRHENEAPFNVTNSDDENSEKQSIVMDKQSATDDKINDDTVQDDVFDNDDFTEQEQNLSEHVTKSQPKSSNILTIDLESDSDVSNTITQDNQPSDITETPEKPAVETSEDSNVLVSSQPALSQEAESKDSFSSKSNVERKSADVFEAEEKSSQLEKNEKDQETVDKDPEVDIAIKLFRDISADEWKKKNDEDDDSSVNSNRQSEKESKQESDAECDLILVDKQAWLAAKDIKEQEEKESFEYDSDDTVLLKSQTDAERANCEAKDLDIASEESVDSKKDEEVEEIKKRKSLTKKRSISKRNKDSSPECVDDEDISVTVVKSKMSLNRSNNPSTSRLNNSGQAAKATRQTHEDSDEEAEEDANELSRSSQVNKNVSLRKSTDKRKSLNKSLMSTSSNQVENNVVSRNKSQMDISEEDNTDAHMEKSLKRTKRSLNKSRDNETVADSECEKDLSNEDNKNTSLNRSINKKSKMMQIEISDDDESDNEGNDKMAALKNYSTIADAGTDTDNHSNSIESLDIPRLFNESSNDDDTDANSINSDIKREYNLDGKKQKFSDDNVVGDECRVSESEYSDSDDDGSDLASFIVSDGKVEDEEDDQNMKKDDESLDEDEEVVAEKDEVENEDGEDEQRIEEDVENEEEDIEIVSEIKNKIVSDDRVKDEGEEDDDDDDDDQSMKKDDESLEDEEIVTEKNEVESKDGEDEQRIEEDDENEEVDVEIISEVENKDNKNIKEEADVEIADKPTVYKNKKTFASNLKSCIKSSTPKQSAVKQTCWISGPLETPSPDLHPALLRKDTWYSGTKKAGKNTFEKSKIPVPKGNTSLKEFNAGNKEEKLNRSLPSDLPDVKIKKAPVVKSDIETNLARLYKTMNISDDDVSTIRHLRKEKLSETAPLRVDTKITPLKKKSLLREETKNTTQMEMKGKNNEEEVSNPPSTDDATEKHSQRKKRKRQAGAVLNENLTDRDQKVIESKTKIEVANRSPMLTVKDVGKNLEQVKKKKKRKQIDVIEQSENVGEDDAANSKLVAQKKKKLVQPTIIRPPILTIVVDDNSKNSDQTNEKKKKKKKKQTGIIEQEENINEDKRNVRRNEMELAQRSKKKADKIVSSFERDSFTDDYMVAKKKRKEKEILKNEETLSEEPTKNIAQIKTKKKVHKQDAYNQMMSISDDTVQKRQKKRKRQVEEPLDENIDDEVVSQHPIETKRKIKRIKFFTTEQEIKLAKQREPVTKDDIYENLDQINEERKKKKKKQAAVTEQDNIMNEDDTYAPKLVGEKKKKKKKKQLDVNQQDNNINEEDTFLKTIREFTYAQSSNNPYAFKRIAPQPISKNENFSFSQLGLVDNTKITDLRQIIEKKKKKKQKQLHAMEQDNNILEDDTYAPEPVGEKKKKKKKRLAVIEQDYNLEDDTYAPEPVGEKKKKRLAVIEQYYNIEDDTYAPEPVGEKKKKRLAVIEQDYNIEDDTYAPEPVGEKKKKKKKQQLGVSQQDDNINEEDTYIPETVEKKKKKKKKDQLDVIQQDNDIYEDDTYVPMPVGEKKKKKNKEKQIEQERNVTELNPKLKLKKNLKSEKKSQVQTIVAKKGIVVTEAWNEAREAIRAAEIRLKTNKELKKRKRSKDDENNVETRNVKMKERKKLVPSSMDTMKRLPNDVIENLSDIPKKKKRKFLREEQSIDSPKKKKPKATTAKNDSELLLDVPGSSTQFSVINMQKAKKQPLRGAAAVASIRQKMLARNNPHEPISAYLMYLEKQRASKKSSKNAF